MPTRVLFVGESPNARGERGGVHYDLVARALGEGAAYRRQPRAWLRSTAKSREPEHAALWQLLRHSETVNVFPEYPGRNGKGSAFPMKEARLEVRYLTRNPCPMFLKHTRAFVLIGRRVAGAFSFPEPFFESGNARGYDAWCVPHPSGLSRTWNDPATARRVRALLIEISERYCR